MGRAEGGSVAIKSGRRKVAMAKACCVAVGERQAVRGAGE